jgi:hypothetical protein
MLKLAVRIITLVLLPCLVVDPAFSITLSQVNKNCRPFESQALVERGLWHADSLATAISAEHKKKIGEAQQFEALLQLLEEKKFKHFSETEPVEGLDHRSLSFFDGLTVVILDRRNRSGEPLYANFVRLLRSRAAALETVYLEDPHARERLRILAPHVAIAPRYDAAAESLIQGTVAALDRDIGVFQFRHPLTRIPTQALGIDANPNVSVGITDESMVSVGDSIDMHGSQKRTPYRPAVEALMKADALLAGLLGLLPASAPDAANYRKNLVNVRIEKDGSISYSAETKHLVVSYARPLDPNAIWIPSGSTILANDPHPDDLPINYGISVRHLLERSIHVVNIVHSTGQNGVPPAFVESQASQLEQSGQFPDLKQATLHLKRTIRMPEAQNAGTRLAEGTPGSVKVVALDLDLDPDAKANRELRLAKFAPLIKSVYKPYLLEFKRRFPGTAWPVFVDHPFDIHYWHQFTAEYDLLALQQLAYEQSVAIEVFFYPGTWAGDEDLYVQTMTNAPHPATDTDTFLPVVHQAMEFAKQGFAYVLWEICSIFPFGHPQFGLAAPDNIDNWGGPYAERFKGTVFRRAA